MEIVKTILRHEVCGSPIERIYGCMTESSDGKVEVFSPYFQLASGALLPMPLSDESEFVRYKDDPDLDALHDAQLTGIEDVIGRTIVQVIRRKRPLEAVWFLLSNGVFVTSLTSAPASTAQAGLKVWPDIDITAFDSCRTFWDNRDAVEWLRQWFGQVADNRP